MGANTFKRANGYKMSMNIFLILFGFSYEVDFECNNL